MKSFKNLKIRTKIALSCAIMAVIFFVSIITSTFSIQLVSRDLKAFFDSDFQIVQTSMSMQTNLQGFAKSLSRVALATENTAGLPDAEAKQYLNEKISQFNGFVTNMQTDLETLNGYTLDDPDAAAQLEYINLNFNSLIDMSGNVLDLYEKGQIEEGLVIATGELDTMGNQFNTSLGVIISAAQAEAVDKYNETQNAAGNIVRLSIILAILLLAAIVAVSFALTRAITKPLDEMEHAARCLAEGDLSAKITYQSDDEVGSLAKSLGKTIDSLQSYIKEIDTALHAVGEGKLNYRSDVEFVGDFVSIKEALDDIATNLGAVIVQINTSAEQVTWGAEQIAGSGQALSQATLEQASSIEELSATINDISDRVNENAGNAAETSALTENVGAQVMESNRQMQEMKAAMEKMKDMSGEITGIIKDIEDIAFQTNILSLNAAVEAARAGEAGKGFSVVAAEIRRLSEKTTEASRSTSDLIGRTVQMMNDGAQMANSTATKLLEVANSARDAADKVEMISTASNNQAVAVVQLRESIEQISEIVQENSATAEESAASSEELTGQMQMLKKLVETFEYDKK